MIKQTVETIADLRKTAGESKSHFVFAEETGNIFRYVADARALRGDNTTPTDDGYIFVQAAQGGNSFWFKYNALPKAVLTLGSAQSVSAGATATVQFDTASYDPFALIKTSNNRIGGNANGLPLGRVLVLANVRLNIVGVDKVVTSRILTNGSAQTNSGDVRTNAVAAQDVTCKPSWSGSVDPVTDYFQADIINGDSSSRNVSTSSRLWIEYTEVWKWGA
jgi:hypothetical protein